MIKIISFGISLLLVKILFAETSSEEDISQIQFTPYHFEASSNADNSSDKKPSSSKQENKKSSSSKKKEKNPIIETGTMKMGAGTVEYTYVKTKPDFFAECEAKWKEGREKDDSEKNEDGKAGEKITITWTSN